MAVEAKRGCGYRKVGGLYLVDEGNGMPCCKMPLALSICPCCGGGIKQTRGWTWIDAGKMFGGVACKMAEAIEPGSILKMIQQPCPAADPAKLGKVGLIWIGESFYPTPADFLGEAGRMGISRRMPAIPRNFRAGETWVLFAHPKAIQLPRTVMQWGATCDWSIIDPRKGEPIEGETIPAARDAKQRAEERAAALDLAEPIFGPGVIRICKPRGFEKIVKQSDYDAAIADQQSWSELEKSLPPEEVVKSALLEQFEADAKRGVKWVPVPDNDPDHQGSVHDDEKETKLPA